MRPSEISRSSAMRAISRRIGLWHETITDFGRVVDDQIDAGRRFDGADVAPFAADDPPLHVVARQVHDRHGPLGDELARQTLDGDGDDLLGASIRFGARLFLDHANVLRGVVPGLVDHLLDEAALRFVARQPGDPLELLAGLVDESIAVLVPLRHLPLLLPQQLLLFPTVSFSLLDLLGTLL